MRCQTRRTSPPVAPPGTRAATSPRWSVHRFCYCTTSDLANDITNDITDHAVCLLDLQDPLEQAIECAYRAAIDHGDVLRRDGQADPAALLIAYGGLRAVLDQFDRHARKLGELLGEPTTIRAAAAK